MDAPLTYELNAGIATITMDDGKANAMNLRMLQGLGAALDRAQADKAVVVLQGRAGMFSGGFDLAVFKKGDVNEMRQMLEAGARLTERLLSHPQPVLAVCTGHAIALGAFLLLSADVRIGPDQGFSIQANEVQIGMTLPQFAIEVCRQRLAPAHFGLVTTTAQAYSSQQAVAAGFLDEIVPAESLAAAAQAQAARLQKLHAQAFTASKLRVRRATLAAMQQAIQEDCAEWAALAGSRAA
jgi:enoyl-CoA hydratase